LSFARASVETTAVRMILVVVTFAVGIITARWLGVEGVGILTLALLMRVLAFRFGNLGLGSAFACGSPIRRGTTSSRGSSI